MCRYGRWVVAGNAKQRDFHVWMDFSKNGGVAPAIEKCVFPREKRDLFGFHPLKRCEFWFKPSQSMRKRPETMRVKARTDRKPTKAVARGVQ